MTDNQDPQRVFMAELKGGCEKCPLVATHVVFTQTIEKPDLVIMILLCDDHAEQVRNLLATHGEWIQPEDAE